MIRAFFLVALPLFAICHEPLSYFCLDNQTIATEIDSTIDPFIVLRTKTTLPKEKYSLQSSCRALVEKRKLILENENFKENRSFQLAITKQNNSSFDVECNFSAKKLWWQISEDPSFDKIAPNLDQIVSFLPRIHLDPISETFLNPHTLYYFRACAITNDMASPWTEPFPFFVEKPAQVKEVAFKKLDHCKYQLSWEKDPSPLAEYLVFGSNSQDFIPSIYCEEQIDAITQSGDVITSPNYNLIAITPSNTIEIDGSLAYYRIIAIDKKQLSVPSELIYVYDNELSQNRDHLVLSEDAGIQRNVFAQANSYLAFTNSLQEYVSHPYISPDTWARVETYILPHNHPIKSALDLMFHHNRVTESILTLHEAGFKTKGGPDNHSKTIFATHKAFKGYVLKIVPDEFDADEVTRLLSRIEGAKTVCDIIDQHNYHKFFKVPKKWLYVLPPEPSPNPNTIRKNFILVAEDMNIFAREENYAMWKSFFMTEERLHAIYTVITLGGMNDCVYAFNLPFSKDGKTTFLDTEDHHKWPIPYNRLNKYLSPDMLTYWNQLTEQ